MTGDHLLGNRTQRILHNIGMSIQIGGLPEINAMTLRARRWLALVGITVFFQAHIIFFFRVVNHLLRMTVGIDPLHPPQRTVQQALPICILGVLYFLRTVGGLKKRIDRYRITTTKIARTVSKIPTPEF